MAPRPFLPHGAPMPDERNLDHCAYAIVDRFRQGRLTETAGIGWTLTWKTLIRVLRSDCPGFSDLQYGIALTNSLTAPGPGETIP